MLCRKYTWIVFLDNSTQNKPELFEGCQALSNLYPSPSGNAGRLARAAKGQRDVVSSFVEQAFPENLVYDCVHMASSQ